MPIALVCILLSASGACFEEYLLSNGGEGTWKLINGLLFQDITRLGKASDSDHINGPGVCERPPAAIVPLVLVSTSSRCAASPAPQSLDALPSVR